ncbi:MAG TPA: delta-60 repeat domain-containing protein, partial [Acidimicrobiia bacterium]|nr:delta-60 repeat domain-containing protein [Acidimicrobiia bacterium]
MPKRHRLLIAGAAALLLLGSGLPAGRALFAAHDTMVSADPADATPHILDGKVDVILPMGNRIYVGGSFTQVRNAEESRIIPRRGLFALDPATNKVDETFVADFDVNPDRTQDRGVKALAAAPGHNELFVGGEFGILNGAAARKLVKINAVNGTLDPSFDVTVSAAVKDLVVNGSRLYLAGDFTSVAGQARSGLAAVDAGSGALDGDVDIAFTVPRQGNEPRVETIAVTPDGTTLVAAGNFTVAGGQSRWQVALVDVQSRPAKVLDWQTNRFDDRDQGQFRCASAFDSHPRDVDIAPDGTYFVIVTTGAYTSRGSLCDTASRWELNARGNGLQPTWANYSGGDSFTAVAVTGAAIYVGGHSRWLNNPKSDGSNQTASPGPGSVVREGIAALDPASGLPLPWNPGRERGEGAWAIASTPDGLWVGSDTDKIGGWTAPGCEGCEFHQKLAFFPLAGGAAPAVSQPQGLPAELLSVGPAGLVKRSFDGAALGAPVLLGAAGDGGRVRGAFWLGGQLYEGRDDGRFLRWSYDGTTFGSAAEVDLRGLPTSHQTYNANVYGFPLRDVTGMFYDYGRLYYTVAGDRRLYYRYFLSQPNVAH